jgi:tRNA(fMet)-specific endonuclease VapC
MRVSLYIFDTDHASMWLENQTNVRRNAEIFRSEIAITIVTVQELFNGWIGKLNHPSSANQQVQLYRKLSRVVAYLKKMSVLDFDESADQVFCQLLLENPPLRKNRIQKDMRIASIALANDAIVVTRNYRDFVQVPNLKILDWSV